MVNVTRGQKQTYTIGLTAYRIGINYTNNLDFIGIIEPELKAFAKNVGKTVFFGVRSDHEVVYRIDTVTRYFLCNSLILYISIKRLRLMSL